MRQVRAHRKRRCEGRVRCCEPGPAGGQRWKAQELTDGEANQTLWKEMRTARKACAGDAGVRAKPARNATGAQQYKHGAGAPDSACQGTPDTQGWKHSSDARPGCGREERSV